MDLLMVLLFMVVGFLVLGVGIAGAVVLAVFALKGEGEARSAWQQVADRLGGTYSLEAGRINPLYRIPQVVAQVYGVRVMVRRHAVHSSSGGSVSTHVSAPCRAPRGFRLGVFTKGRLRKLTEAMGAQDVPTGDPAFDEAFSVKSSIPELVPAWLHPEVRAMLASEACAMYGFSIDNGEVHAAVEGMEGEPERLVYVMHTVAALARGPVR